MKIKALFTVPLLLGILAGCGDGDSDVERDELVENPNPTNGVATDNSTSTDGTATGNSTQTEGQGEGLQEVDTNYNFTNFDLDVEYQDDLSYNAEYTNTQNQVTAELEDEIINKLKISGDEAFKQISPSLAQLTFDQETEDQEVINQVLKAFGLEDNYKEFELEVKFQDGQEKEYKSNK